MRLPANLEALTCPAKRINELRRHDLWLFLSVNNHGGSMLAVYSRINLVPRVIIAWAISRGSGTGLGMFWLHNRAMGISRARNAARGIP